MLPDREEEINIKPWTFSRNNLPVETRSDLVLIHCGIGRPLRPRARRKKHRMDYEDALRMMLKLIPPEDQASDTWSEKFLKLLKNATLEMMDRLLFFLPDQMVNEIYDWSIQILDKLFRQSPNIESRESLARRIILEIANKANIYVSLEL